MFRNNCKGYIEIGIFLVNRESESEVNEVQLQEVGKNEVMLIGETYLTLIAIVIIDCDSYLLNYLK